MDSLNIDLRDNHLRILSIRDGRVRYSGIVENFSISDEKSAREALLSELRKAGIKRGKVNIIIPSEYLRRRLFHLPLMELTDTKKLIKRELTKEFKGKEFVFGIRRLISPKETGEMAQDIVAEYCRVDSVNSIIGFFERCGLRPEMVTSALEGNLRAFNKFRPETEGNEAVIEIGSNSMEVIVVNNGRLVKYEDVLIPPIHEEDIKKEGLPAERVEKMRLFRIVDALYNSLMPYRERSVEERLSKLWICGIGGLIEGISAAISDGIGVSVDLLDPFGPELENGFVFSAIRGVSSIQRGDVYLDLIPEALRYRRTRLIRSSVLAAALSFYLLMIMGGYLILEESISSLRDLYKKEEAVLSARAGKKGVSDSYSEGYKTMVDLYSHDQRLYGVFKDIANLIPEGVLLKSLQFEKSEIRQGEKEGFYKVNIEAVAPYPELDSRDRVIGKAVLSKFVTGLDSSSHLRRISPPQITVTKEQGNPKEFLIKLSYEVKQ